MPLNSSASWRLTPSLLIKSRYTLPPLTAPSITMARMPSLSSFWAVGPPAFASLIPRVSGLLPPTEMRPHEGASVPDSGPQAITSLASVPSGSVLGGTSLVSILAHSPLPPTTVNSSARSSNLVSRRLISTRKILMPCPFTRLVHPTRSSCGLTRLANPPRSTRFLGSQKRIMETSGQLKSISILVVLPLFNESAVHPL